jgi:hypothetical protein
MLCLPRRQPCERSLFSYSHWSECPSPAPMPMPARGARTTAVAFQTALILRTSNAGPRLAAWQHIARRIHFPGRPTGLPPEVGIPPTRRGGIGAAIREVRRTASPRLTASMPQQLGAPCGRSFLSRSRWQGSSRPVHVPMPVHGARPIDGAVQIAAIPPPSNAGPRCAA